MDFNLTYNAQAIPKDTLIEPADYQFEFKSYEPQMSKNTGKLMIMVEIEGCNIPANDLAKNKKMKNWYVIANDAAPDRIDERVFGTIQLRQLIESCNVALSGDLQRDLDACVGAQFVVAIGKREDDRTPGEHQNTVGKTWPLSAGRVIGLTDAQKTEKAKQTFAKPETQFKAPKAETTATAVSAPAQEAFKSPEPAAASPQLPGNMEIPLDANGNPDIAALQAMVAAKAKQA